MSQLTNTNGLKYRVPELAYVHNAPIRKLDTITDGVAESVWGVSWPNPGRFSAILGRKADAESVHYNITGSSHVTRRYLADPLHS
jgi:hypothetical protein